MKKITFKELAKLYWSFLKIGSFTIGGGLAMLPMMEKELITKRGWITEEELMDYYAVGQSTPGIVAVNVSTFVGYKNCGILGGIFATLGMVTPSWLIIMILATLINSISEYPVIQKALRGINVAVAALLTSVIIKFAKKSIKNVLHIILMLVAFVLIFFFKLQSFWIILATLIVGVVITVIQQKKMNKIEDAQEEQK